MRHYLLVACEQIDASVFSSDMLFSDEDRATLKEYVERWQRAITEHESTVDDGNDGNNGKPA